LRAWTTGRPPWTSICSGRVPLSFRAAFVHAADRLPHSVLNVQHTFVPVFRHLSLSCVDPADRDTAVLDDASSREPVGHHQHRIETGHHEPPVSIEIKTGYDISCAKLVAIGVTLPTTHPRPPSRASRRAWRMSFAHALKRTSGLICSCASTLTWLSPRRR